ncbi:hypothetical protein KX729_26185 [Rhizobium sp. XQZ8]|uniref:hypothetical protein n=1 Tax=Rhizobium populisoli TaxID=2859785 RepID=UPI001CA539F3|nr:hypothetical protein [Rhizobium populisoli]MBW6424936.1 hypothetical protein [Rhizobium populisoli]
MIMQKILKTAIVAVSLASMGLVASGGFDGDALAKSGNGNSGGGGGNGGSGGHGNGSGKDHASNTNNSKNSHGRPDKIASRAATQREDRALHRAEKSMASELRGLNSLKRNYHAYFDSKDPRLAGVASYVQDYARYELRTGTIPALEDPELGDAALTAALSGFSKATITSRQLSWAKDVLGVGSSVGKIDQVREAMEKQADARE